MPKGKYIAYVSNADTNDIHVFELNVGSGELTLLQVIPTGGFVMPLAVSPGRDFLFATNRLEPHLTVSFQINRQNGQLKKVSETEMPFRMAYISVDLAGRILFGASYSDHKLVVAAIDAEGRIQPPHQIIDTPPHAHAVLADPSNRFVFATSLGADRVLHYKYDPLQGLLAENEPPFTGFPSKSGPRHLVFHPNRRFVFVCNELDATVSSAQYDEDRGALSLIETMPLLPSGFEGKPWASDIHLTPDGQFLYAAERTSSTITAFTVASSTGVIEQIGRFETERQPRGFNIDPTGRFLISVGQESHAATVHRIGPGGALTEEGRYPVGKNPTWVEIVELPT